MSVSVSVSVASLAQTLREPKSSHRLSHESGQLTLTAAWEHMLQIDGPCRTQEKSVGSSRILVYLWLTQDFAFNRVQPVQSMWTRIKVHLDASFHIKSTSDDLLYFVGFGCVSVYRQS